MILLIDVGGVEVTSSVAIYWHYQVSYGKVALFLTLTHIYTKVFFFRFPQPGFIGVDVFSVLYPQMPIPPSPPRLAKCHCRGKFCF